MSFLKNLVSAFGGPQGDEPGNSSTGKLTAESKLTWRKLALGDYDCRLAPAKDKQKFELRYSAYGEVSSLFITQANLKRVGAKDSPGFNAVAMDIDLEGNSVASLIFLNDGPGGFASEESFGEEISSLRLKHHGHIGELSVFDISKDHKSRRAIGALWHVLYLYARQARQVACIFVRSEAAQASFYEQMLGFKAVATQGDVVLLALEVSQMKQHIRAWGGKQKDPSAEDAPYKLYPFFFPSKDEPGLIFRVLEHLNTSS